MAIVSILSQFKLLDSFWSCLDGIILKLNEINNSLA